MGRKKEKITYIDDGRTQADMTNLPGARLGRRNPAAPRPTFKEVWSTYWGAVKMMFLPMLACIGGICLLFLLTSDYNCVTIYCVKFRIDPLTNLHKGESRYECKNRS